MKILRARYPGDPEWTMLAINGEAEAEEDIESIIGSALETSPLVVQVMNEEGEWEELT